MNDSFIGERLYIARSFKGMTQKDLAEQVVTTVSMISYLEKNQRKPAHDLIEAIGQVLGFEKDFFYQKHISKVKYEECNFRSLSNTSETLKKRVIAHCSLLSIIAEYLKQSLEFPEYNVPKFEINTPRDIQKAAEYCRQEWKLTRNAPISNIIRVLENAGVVTHSYNMGTNKIDAFSRNANINIIILNEYKQSTSRSTWDATHELGHLVLHNNSEVDIKEREKQANIFASEFLLPRSGFIGEFGIMRKLNWKHLFNLKKRWKVSVAAIIRRAYELNLIDAIQYRRGYKYIHANGWHLGEPEENELERNKPELLNTAIEDLESATGEKPEDMAESLGISNETFEKITGMKIAEKVINNNIIPPITILKHDS